MNTRNQRPGFSLVETMIIVGLFGALIVFGVVLINNEKAKARDAMRLSDMSRIEAAFTLLFSEKNSYADAASGCDAVNNLADSCSLQEYLPSISQIKDPGRYKYLVTKVPSAEGFAITFHLERNYRNLAKGQHVLSQAGTK